jgi:hypothetical protein
MTSLKTSKAPAPRNAALLEAVARVEAGTGGPGSTRRASLLVRVWQAVTVAWLAKRLQSVETELLELTACHAGKGRSMISKQDMTLFESCCMERAILRARIAAAKSWTGARGQSVSPSRHSTASKYARKRCALVAKRSTGHSPSDRDRVPSATSR